MTGWLVGIIVVVGFCWLLFKASTTPDLEDDYDDDHSIDWHRRNGKYQVYYPDCDMFSQPFTYKTATNYAEIYKGQVVPLGHAHPNNPYSPTFKRKTNAT